jgi:hypothetical protein
MRIALMLLLFAIPLQAVEPISADALVLKLLDSEALYTVRGPIKPISEGFWHLRFPEAESTTPEIEHVRRTLNAMFDQASFATGVHVFAKAHDGKKYVAAFIAHRPLVRGIVLKYPKVFEPLGVTFTTEPLEILNRVDRAGDATRWRAYGLLFGYPGEAVDFFVEAGLRQKSTGVFVERDFRHIPTFASKQGNFVYAVPKGSAETWLDRDLKRRAEPIFDDYKSRREEWVGEGKPGAVAMLQSWTCRDCPALCVLQGSTVVRHPHFRFRRIMP